MHVQETLALARPVTIAVLGVAALVVLFLTGCVGPGPFRTVAPKDATKDNYDHWIIDGHPDEGFRLGYVELDDQGWFWTPDRAQMGYVQQMVSDAAQLGPGQTRRPIILVAFVHGWENNASEAASNVSGFRDELSRMAAAEKAAAAQRPAGQDSPRPVVGVYIGWPGISVDMDFVQYLTFWSRKSAGDRVGWFGGVTEVLTRLQALSNEINTPGHVKGAAIAQAGEGLRSYFVVVGHSFGAQVVFDSLLPIMTENVVGAKITKYAARLSSAAPSFVRSELAAGQETLTGGERVRPFADIVVLINPAFEGERYYNLKTLAEMFEYAPGQRPVLAIFCSRGDSATRVAFPFGRYVSTLLHRYRSDELGGLQGEADKNTIPWTDSFVTHRLDKAPAQPAAQMLAAESLALWTDQMRVKPLSIGGCVLTPLSGDPAKWTPFYVVRVASDIIPDHSQIWTDSFRNFLTAFIGEAAKSRSE